MNIEDLQVIIQSRISDIEKTISAFDKDGRSITNLQSKIDAYLDVLDLINSN